MPLPSLLLRVLLSLSLILNGSGYAFASGHLQMQSAASTMAEGGVAQDSSQSQAPCHDEGGIATALPATTDTQPADSPHDPGHRGADCCQSGSCRCICAHGSVAVVPPLRGNPGAPMHAAMVQPLLAGYPAPVLPHLIRPPIG